MFISFLEFQCVGRAFDLAEETISDQVLVDLLPLFCGLGQDLLDCRATISSLAISIGVPLCLVLLRRAVNILWGLCLDFLLGLRSLDHTESVL